VGEQPKSGKLELSGLDLQRRAPRVAMEARGYLAGRVQHAVDLVDLSRTGCLVRCDAALDSGSILDLRLEFEWGAIEAKVRVAEAFVDGPSVGTGRPRWLVGVDFLALSVEQEARLRALLDEAKRRGRGEDTTSR
jgi:hypothetical protein